MTTNGDRTKSPYYHPYQGSPDAVTRPEWITKHDDVPKSRNLLPYILQPHKYTEQIIWNSPDAVLIKDKFPKANVHLLVLPKWEPHRDMHPHDAFEDADFLTMIRAEAAEGLKLAMAMLKSSFHKDLIDSGMNAKQVKALLTRRDFSKDFQIGIHAHPSQHELHVHIISHDMVSWHHYGARHYQAFNTPFLVKLDLYPLPLDDVTRSVNYQNDNLMKDDFECWRCGKNFGNDWALMKKHLEKEWQAWIREERNDIMPVDSSALCD